MSDAGALLYEAVTKAVLYLALQCVVGAAAAYWLARGCGAIAHRPSAIERQLRRAALWASAALLAAALGRALGHTAAVFGSLGVDSLRTVALESRWGHAWRLQTGAAALASVAALTTGTRRIGWPLYSIAALLVCASVPLLGHGAGAPEGMVLHGLHVMAGAIWIGTLVMLATLASRCRASDQADVYVMVAAFSRVALPSAAILLATGTIVSVLYVQQLAHLWDTVYGRVLVAKLALVAVVAAGGRRNWQRSQRGMAPSLRVMMMELAAAVLVVAVTGVLSELEHP